MILIVDVENKASIKNGKLDLSPYHPDNFLVSVGWRVLEAEEGGAVYGDTGYLFLRHKEGEFDPATEVRFRGLLARATLIVGHNLKHDLEWLLECGYTTNAELYCTMVAEYILARGLKWGMGLDDALERYGLGRKRKDLVQEYLDQGMTFDQIPADVVREYGQADVDRTADLFCRQQKEYYKAENVGLLATRKMMNEFLYVLTGMQREGIKVDLEALERVEAEYRAEQKQLQSTIGRTLATVMGDTPININSPEQLSMVLYSRRVKDKATWSDIFNLGMEQRGAAKKPKRRPKLTELQFVQAVRANTEIITKTTAQQCPECEGVGHTYPRTKADRPGKAKRYCKTCGGKRFLYLSTGDTAGFKVTPRGVDDIAAGGFSTDGDTLDAIALRYPNRADLREFVTAIGRLNQIDTYLSTFVNGIRDATRSDGILHPQFLQCVTATGRLASRSPNLQNQPRGRTFPIRRVFVSRWPGGKILEADFKALEYRVAVDLAQDKAGIHDILHNVDAHAFTAEHIFPGMPLSESRTPAKPHTFAPLYGATPDGKPDAVARYYKAFMEKHKGVAKWQEKLQDEAIRTKKIVLPSGREYGFPNAYRTGNGGSTFATQIKNYPVQGFATADIVPVAGIILANAFISNSLLSVLVLTVHDSYIVDVHPGEIDTVPRIVYMALVSVRDELIRRYGYKFSVPIDIEMKMGDNWLDGIDIQHNS